MTRFEAVPSRSGFIRIIGRKDWGPTVCSTSRACTPWKWKQDLRGNSSGQAAGREPRNMHSSKDGTGDWTFGAVRLSWTDGYLIAVCLDAAGLLKAYSGEQRRGLNTLMCLIHLAGLLNPYSPPDECVEQVLDVSARSHAVLLVVTTWHCWPLLCPS